MLPFLRRYWGRLTILGIIFILLMVILFMPSRYRARISSNLFTTSQKIYQPPARAISLSGKWISNEMDFFLRQQVLNKEIVNLQKENSWFRKQQMESLEKEKELDRFRRILELKNRLDMKTVAAEVIAVAPSNYYLTLILDKGSSAGISKNMVVMNEDGVIGRILQSGPSSSKILLIADQRSALSILVERTQSRGILEGIGNGKCKVVMENPMEQIKVGDKIFTSGLGGIFPKGLYVGIIDYIDRDKRSGWALTIQVQPAADNYNIQEALIIVDPVIPPVDTKTLEEK